MDDKLSNYFGPFDSYNDLVIKCTDYINSSALFSKVPKENKNSELYKLFQYDEESNVWVKKDVYINKLIVEKYFNKSDRQTVLVLFLDSYENDVQLISSEMINSKLPIFDDQNIYVYALCDKQLKYFQYYINDSQKYPNCYPIFLSLHVPKEKQNLPNISEIVFSIYFYLSIICDINIIILNKEHYNDQIHLAKCLCDINNSYNTLNHEAQYFNLEDDDLIMNKSTFDDSSSDDMVFLLSI